MELNFPIEYLIKKLYEEIYNETIDDSNITALIESYRHEYRSLLDSEFTLTRFEDNVNYNKIKDFFANRYSKLKVLIDYISKLSKNYSELPDYFLNLLLIQFGVEGYNELDSEQKRMVLENIINYMTKRGTKDLVLDAFRTLLKFKKIEMGEFDIIKTPDNVYKLVNYKTKMSIDLDSINSYDPHWLMNNITLQSYVDNNKAYFPLRTQYFSIISGITSINNFIEQINFIYVIIKNELEKYYSSGALDKRIYVSLFDKPLSLTELWLTITLLLIKLADVTHNNRPDPSTVEGVVIYDEDITQTDDQIAIQLYENLNTQFPELKNLSIQFYLDHSDNFDSVKYEDFKIFIMTNWTEYYALEEEVSSAIIYSLYLSLLLTKNSLELPVIENIYKSIIRLPESYTEKYKSCSEDPNIGLLYYCYDKYLFGDFNENSIIIQILKDPEFQLNTIGSSKIIEFIDKVFDNLDPTKYESDTPDIYGIKDILSLILYFLRIVKMFLYTYYGFDFNTDYILPYDILFNISKISDSSLIKSVKPINARELGLQNSNTYNITNPLTESFLYDYYMRFFVREHIHEPYNITEKLFNYLKTSLFDDEYIINDRFLPQLQSTNYDDYRPFGERVYYRVIAITDGITIADTKNYVIDLPFPGYINEEFSEPPFRIDHVPEDFIVELVSYTET